MARATDELDVVTGQAELRGDQRGRSADSPGVLLGLVVAVLGRQREAAENLDVRVLEVTVSLRHLPLEGDGPLVEPSLELCFVAASGEGARSPTRWSSRRNASV
jgi:hypothetical protein